MIFETAEGRRVIGQAVGAEGKTTTVKVIQGNYRGGIERIHVEGKEELTCAETARDEFLLRLLLGEVSLYNRSFIEMVWFPKQGNKLGRFQHSAPFSEAFAKLNKSQKEVAAAMISTTESLVIAHGMSLRSRGSVCAEWTYRLQVLLVLEKRRPLPLL